MMGSIWRRKGNAYDLKHTTSSVKHGRGNGMAWTYMAASGTRSLVFIADVIADSSSRMSCEVYMAIAPAQSQPAAKLTRWLFTVGL